MYWAPIRLKVEGVHIATYKRCALHERIVVTNRAARTRNAPTRSVIRCNCQHRRLRRRERVCGLATLNYSISQLVSNVQLPLGKSPTIRRTSRWHCNALCWRANAITPNLGAPRTALWSVFPVPPG